MKIALNSFASALDLQLVGDEPWLEKIYKDFCTGSSRIQGSLTIQRDASGGAMISGHIQFIPMVDCGRCAKSVAMPLAVNIKARFHPESENPERADNWKRERNLSRDDLDAYYIDSGMIDVEEVVNDAIHTATPDSYVPTSDDGNRCLVCRCDLSSPHVFGKEHENEKPSPFASLKRLTIKH